MTRPSIQTNPRRTSRRLPSVWLALSCALLVSACTRHDTAVTKSDASPRVVETSRSGVSVTFTFDPPVVRLDRDILLTIRVASPTNLAVKLPPVENRVTGFVVSGSYDGHTTVNSGKTFKERHVRLTPQISKEYRIAPMAITWKDPSSGQEQWFPTQPVVVSSESLVKGDPGKSIAAPRGPAWIYPGMKGFLGYTLGILGVAALAYGAWRLLRKIQRAVKLHRMSPRERALFELAGLMARDLVGHDRVKEFYFELTMIVRLYIERAHAIRAPEQTTEEFLIIVSRDSRFQPDVAGRLREFLQAADLVKYAGVRPEPASVDGAISTARNYIETDSTPLPAST